MRDYSFGNFLHELRVRRGLSQFQLGMLVGVSNKAVSKWENGSAKPQSRILYKLGEVLGVTVDELLACKYRSTENKNIKGVFAMKKALWKKAGETLTSLYGSLYGSVPPMEAVNRYYSEYAELKNTDQILYYDFLSRMAGLAERSGGHMHINGGIGASFVAFVLGVSEINPLRPHYYCPDCHKIQFVDGVLCGWDLPAKKCSCGRELIRDGHNLPFETLRPIISRDAHYDISVSQNLYQAAGEVISTCFQANKIVALTRENPDVRTYIILDAEFPGLANGQELAKSGMPISRLIAYQDDVFHYIQEKMKLESSSGTGYAFQIMEDVRRGVYLQNGMPAEIRQQLLELGIQEWLIESLGKIQYLFPKAHGILHVKHAMILMWYKIYYPEAFKKIILKGIWPCPCKFILHSFL
ncbi:MAG: helix-turn-helix domain-containing protein [Acetatifactor sp.]|nr:helix-turn-helix domain-containing protein [Acetatifactor sp.]